MPMATVVTSEEDLVYRLKEGDRAAFLELFDQFHQTVYDLSHRLLNDREEALDCSQEVFLAILRNIRSFQRKSSLRTWIYRITINNAYNRYRSWKRKKRKETLSLSLYEDEFKPKCWYQSLVSKEIDPETQLLNKELNEKIEFALKMIPFKLRVAVVMRDVQGVSYEEISEALAIRLGTVKSRIARGREELRKILNELFQTR
jgi:RNA polymerase sigma-70 factor (ECF subfamily)